MDSVCNPSLMTCLISFPSMLRRMIEQKFLEELYTALFGFGIMIEVNILKYKGQKTNVDVHISEINKV